jgi:hypothetical protein
MTELALGKKKRNRLCSRFIVLAAMSLPLASGLTFAADAPATTPAPPSAPSSPPATQPSNAQADPAIAERLVDVAAEVLAKSGLSTANYEQAAAFLEAASRLNPAEPRYHRLRYEASLQAGAVGSAIDALIAYARLEPSDLQAQAKLIELYAQRMETADDKLRYLRQDLLPTTSIPAEVRAHAAVMACRVLLERGERKSAEGLAFEATRLNPLDPEAQRLRFDLSTRDGTPVDRLGGLLAIVRASPLELGAVMSVGDELAQAGITDAPSWYSAAVNLCARNGTTPPRELVINYAASLLTVSAERDSEAWVERILQVDPADISAHFIRLSLDRIQGNPADIERHKAEARTALFNRYIELANDAGVTTATTRPYSTTEAFDIPDPVALAARIKAKNDPRLAGQFEAAAGDIVFFELFFAGKPEKSPQLVEAVRSLVPADSPLLARIEGWLHLAKGEKAEARQRLSAIEASDPLAALGMLRLDSDNKDTAQANETRARGLRNSSSHGVTGAIVMSELIPRKTPLVLTTQAEQMRQTLAAFPSDLLRLIDAPQSFYVIKAEPLKGDIPFASPMLIRVTITNTSPLDLSLGPNSAIRNDVFLDAQARGLRPQTFPAVAYDRLSGPLVLRSRQQASRIMRLDRGRLLTYLRGSPYTSTSLTGAAVTNPAILGERLASGAGGYAVQFTRILEQQPVPTIRPEQRQAFFDGLSNAPSAHVTPAQRLSLIDAAVVYYVLLAQNAPADQQDVPARLRSVIDALASDPEPTARSWGTFWGLMLAKGDARDALAQTASFDPYWLTRLLSLAGVRAAGIDTYQRIATQLAADPDPTVSRYARAALDEIDEARANAAATQPAARSQPPGASPAPAQPTPDNKP